MKLTSKELQLLERISDAGGSICPGVDVIITSEARRSLNRMKRGGLLREEETDDGARWHLTAQGRDEVDHG